MRRKLLYFTVNYVFMTVIFNLPFCAKANDTAIWQEIDRMYNASVFMDYGPTTTWSPKLIMAKEDLITLEEETGTSKTNKTLSPEQALEYAKRLMSPEHDKVYGADKDGMERMVGQWMEDHENGNFLQPLNVKVRSADEYAGPTERRIVSLSNPYNTINSQKQKQRPIVATLRYGGVDNIKTVPEVNALRSGNSGSFYVQKNGEKIRYDLPGASFWDPGNRNAQPYRPHETNTLPYSKKNIKREDTIENPEERNMTITPAKTEVTTPIAPNPEAGVSHSNVSLPPTVKVSHAVDIEDSEGRNMTIAPAKTEVTTPIAPNPEAGVSHPNVSLPPTVKVSHTVDIEDPKERNMTTAPAKTEVTTKIALNPEAGVSQPVVSLPPTVKLVKVTREFEMYDVTPPSWDEMPSLVYPGYTTEDTSKTISSLPFEGDEENAVLEIVSTDHKVIDRAREIMEMYHLNYLSGFICALTEIISIHKDRISAHELAYAAAKVVTRASRDQRFIHMGRATQKALDTYPGLLTAPGVVLKDLMNVIHLIFQNHSSLSPEAQSILEEIENWYTTEEGEQLLKLLVAVEEYPKQNVSAVTIMNKVLDAIFDPYTRLRGSPQRQAVLDRIEIRLSSSRKHLNFEIGNIMGEDETANKRASKDDSKLKENKIKSKNKSVIDKIKSAKYIKPKSVQRNSVNKSTMGKVKKEKYSISREMQRDLQNLLNDINSEKYRKPSIKKDADLDKSDKIIIKKQSDAKNYTKEKKHNRTERTTYKDTSKFTNVTKIYFFFQQYEEEEATTLDVNFKPTITISEMSIARNGDDFGIKLKEENNSNNKNNRLSIEYTTLSGFPKYSDRGILKYDKNKEKISDQVDDGDSEIQTENKKLRLGIKDQIKKKSSSTKLKEGSNLNNKNNRVRTKHTTFSSFPKYSDRGTLKYDKNIEKISEEIDDRDSEIQTENKKLRLGIEDKIEENNSNRKLEEIKNFLGRLENILRTEPSTFSSVPKYFVHGVLKNDKSKDETTDEMSDSYSGNRIFKKYKSNDTVLSTDEMSDCSSETQAESQNVGIRIKNKTQKKNSKVNKVTLLMDEFMDQDYNDNQHKDVNGKSEYKYHQNKVISKNRGAYEEMVINKASKSYQYTKLDKSDENIIRGRNKTPIQLKLSDEHRKLESKNIIKKYDTNFRLTKITNLKRKFTEKFHGTNPRQNVTPKQEPEKYNNGNTLTSRIKEIIFNDRFRIKENIEDELGTTELKQNFVEKNKKSKYVNYAFDSNEHLSEKKLLERFRENFLETTKLTSKKYELKHILEESSYSDQEYELKFKINNALKQGDTEMGRRFFDNKREEILKKIREETSETDYEELFKKGLNKAIGSIL